MPIVADLQKLSLDAEIYLFSLSGFNPLSPFESFNFSNCLGVTFNGVPYVAIAAQITGLSYTSEGSLPRPKLEVADPDGIITSIAYLYGGLEGATLEIKSTLKRYLDNGATPDPTALRITDSYQISQKIREVPGTGIEYELSSSIDVTEEYLPGRLAVNKCTAIYRNADTGCPYADPRMFNLNNRPTLNERADRCSKTIQGCEARFGKNAVLPWNGIPSGSL
jgi:lambda family phage minor tail protein L